MNATAPPHRPASQNGAAIAVLAETIEIARRPGDVFAYATSFSHFPEWQAKVISASPVGDGPLGVGSTAAVTRRIGARKLLSTEEITEYNRPLTWTIRGSARFPVIATARGAIEPLSGGEQSRLTIALEFEAHGIGKLLLPLVILPQARKQLTKDVQALKQRLENALVAAR
jgi:hypothetical protein